MFNVNKGTGINTFQEHKTVISINNIKMTRKQILLVSVLNN